MQDQNTKVCRICEQAKLCSEFGTDKRRIEGIRDYCKSCACDITKRRSDEIKFLSQQSSEPRLCKCCSRTLSLENFRRSFLRCIDCIRAADAKRYARERTRRLAYSRQQAAEIDKSVKKEYSRRYRHSERGQKKAKEYREAIAESARRYKEKWRLANLGRLRKKAADRRKNNPHEARISADRRRVRLLGAEGSHTEGEVEELLTRQGQKCANLACRIVLIVKGKRLYHRDHIIPLVKGGSNWISNIQLLCANCNFKKNAKSPEQWAKENGLLFV